MSIFDEVDVEEEISSSFDKLWNEMASDPAVKLKTERAIEEFKKEIVAALLPQVKHLAKQVYSLGYLEGEVGGMKLGAEGVVEKIKQLQESSK